MENGKSLSMKTGYGANLKCELINNYTRIAEKTDVINRSRCPMCEMWQKFIFIAQKLVLSIRKPIKKIEDVYSWMKKVYLHH